MLRVNYNKTYFPIFRDKKNKIRIFILDLNEFNLINFRKFSKPLMITEMEKYHWWSGDMEWWTSFFKVDLKMIIGGTCFQKINNKIIIWKIIIKLYLRKIFFKILFPVPIYNKLPWIQGESRVVAGKKII